MRIECRFIRGMTVKMSAFVDFVQFGKSGVFAGLFASTLGMFEFFEKLSSDNARTDFAKYLRSTDFVKSLIYIPKDMQIVFERIFGTSHFSLRCISRSVAFSAGAIAVGIGLSVLNDPQMNSIFEDVRADAAFFTFVEIWFVWSIIADFVNLLKTRVVLRVLVRHKIESSILLAGILIADLLIGILVFYVNIKVATLVAFTIHPDMFTGPRTMEEYDDCVDVYGQCSSLLNLYFDTHFDTHEILSWVLHPLSAFGGLLLWVSMLPSIWLWLYVIASLLARLMAKSAPLLRFLLYFLDIDKHPIRSIGFIAAILVVTAYAVDLGIISAVALSDVSRYS